MLQRALWSVGKAVAIGIVTNVLGLDVAADEPLDSGSGDGDESFSDSDTTSSDTTNVFYGRR